ncbi:MAG: PulJ/GspJ family protein [bacterium]
MKKGFTLVEILVAMVILALGILAASQLTIISMRTNKKIRDGREARELLTRGMEVLKMITITDPLVSATCDSTQLDDTLFAIKADSTNIVGRTIGNTVYSVFWNVADNYPVAGVKTIRMQVYRNGKRIISSDYAKWR